MEVEKEEEKPKVRTKKSTLNKDGIEKGKILTEKEYWILVNKKGTK